MSGADNLAIFGLAGVVLGAAITALVQLVTSRQAINAERERLRERMQGEAKNLLRTELRQLLANLLTATDPQAGGSTQRIVALTHAIDLLLEPDQPAQEQLRCAIIDLSTYVADPVRSSVHNPLDPKKTLELQNLVYRAAREVI